MSDLKPRPSTRDLDAESSADAARPSSAHTAATGPRWLVRTLAWADAEAGTYRVHRVRLGAPQAAHVETHIDGETAVVKARHLRAIPMFRDMPDPMLAALAQRFRTVKAATGATLVSEGEQGTDMFVLCAGHVEVYRDGPGKGTTVITSYGPGAFFGEMALLSGRPRNASVRAVSDVILSRLSKVDFELLLELQPGVYDTFKEMAADRLAREDEGFNLTSASAADRVPTVTHVELEEDLESLSLSSIAARVEVEAGGSDTRSSGYERLTERGRLVVEALAERQEWELVNHPAFGLAKRVSPSQRVTTRGGPPTPDDLDELLTRVWKEPSFFLAHPRAIAAFGVECTRAGIVPATTTLHDATFLTWRGVPLVPCDKVAIEYGVGGPTTRIFLLRVGAGRRGVVGVRQPGSRADRLPGFGMRPSAATPGGTSYVVSVQFSLAVHAADALASLDGVALVGPPPRS